MSPVRLGVSGLGRESDEVSGYDSPVSFRRGVVAGSAARMAEKARRAAGPETPMTRPSLALRSAGGVVSRRSADSVAPLPQTPAALAEATQGVASGVTAAGEEQAVSPDATAAESADAGVAAGRDAQGFAADAPTGGLQQAAQWFRKLFRGA